MFVSYCIYRSPFDRDDPRARSRADKERDARLRELLAAAGSVIRVAAPREEATGAAVQVEDVAILLDKRAVRVADKPIPLTAGEFDVLAVLARHAGEPVSRQQLLNEGWSTPQKGQPRRDCRLDVRISGIRPSCLDLVCFARCAASATASEVTDRCP